MRRDPVRVESFHTYTGSLTTPGCTEGVRWSVVANEVTSHRPRGLTSTR